MTANVFNQVSYLRTSREFPEDLRQLTIECNKSYIDVANAVNSRTISIFPTIRPVINGETWYLNNQSQNGFRQVYPFTGVAGIVAPINHNINVASIYGFTRIYGTFTDGTNWYPLDRTAVTAANNGVNITVTPTQILVTGGGGGGQPVLVSGFVVLEWISRV